MNVAKPKYFADVNLGKPPEYYEYDNLKITFGDPEKYEVIKKIGRGKYSEVFEGINSENNEKIVIKVLKPVRSKKIKREIRILQILKGGPNIIELLDVVKDSASGTISLIFEHVENDDFRKLYPSFKEDDVKFYTFQILKALEYSHSCGIMHRDVKPQNLMINHAQKNLKLIDWGLAEFYFPGKDYNVRVSSRYFKGPELLVDYQYYDYSLDIWSLAATIAGIIFMKEPFFQGSSNQDQLEKINAVLGTQNLVDYVKKYKITLDDEFEGILGRHNEKPFNKFVTPANKHLCSKEVLDLLSKMLIYDHSERITPTEAMNHVYFESIRKTQSTK